MTFEKLKCTSIHIIITLSRDNYVSVILRFVHGLLAILYRLIKNFRSVRNKETRVESTLSGDVQVTAAAKGDEPSIITKYTLCEFRDE